MPDLMTSAEVREKLLEALGLDLVGPIGEVSPDARERLEQSPSQWYLTGFLVPRDRRVVRDLGVSALQQRSLNLQADLEEEDEQENDLDDAAAERPTGADDTDKETPKASGKPRFLQSSLGLTVLAPGNCRSLRVIARWSDYAPVEADETDDDDQGDHLGDDSPDYDPSIGGELQEMLEGIGEEAQKQKHKRGPTIWERTPGWSELTIELDNQKDQLSEADLPPYAQRSPCPGPGSGWGDHCAHLSGH